MTEPARPRVLDAAALLAVDRGDTYTIVVIDVVLRSGGGLLVPACALAAAIAARPAAEARLLAFVQHDQVDVAELTEGSARRVGRLLARGKLPVELLPAAHVVYVAAEHDRCPVLAGDPDAIRRVDPDLTIDQA